MTANEQILNAVFKITEGLVYQLDNNRIVTIFEPQEHKVQKFFRRIGLKIPLHKKIVLDNYANFVFLQIDGKQTVKEIGEQLDAYYGAAVHPLYERLLMFLEHMEKNCGYIYRV
jgi:hypothetical protein